MNLRLFIFRVRLVKKIAILIPVFNNQDGFIKSISSIDSCKRNIIEVVAVDDGSSEQLFLPSQFSCNNIKINIIRLENNSGIIVALNKGLEYIYHNKFDYIARLDAGDICTKKRIQKQLDFLNQNERIGLVGSYASFFDMSGKELFTYKPPVTHDLIKRKMHLNSCFCHPAVMFRASIAEKVGFYSNKYKDAEDYDYFWRFLEFTETYNLPEVLIQTEANPLGLSRLRRKNQLRTRLALQLKKFKVSYLNSYIGIIQTLIFLSTPSKLPEMIKKYFLKRS